MPSGAKVIHVGLDGEKLPCAWAEVDTNLALEPVGIFITGTGQALPARENDYIGSIHQGVYVWHVFV